MELGQTDPGSPHCPTWLKACNQAFRDGIKVATLGTFTGYRSAIIDELEDAVAVFDAFHAVKLGSDAVDEVRRRVRQSIHGHRGRKGDPLYGIRLILRCGQEKLADKQEGRLANANALDERPDEVYVAWQRAQQLRDAYRHENLTQGRKIAIKILDSFPTCPLFPRSDVSAKH